MEGVVTRVLLSKGFGFVRGDDGVSRFFHRNFLKFKPDFETMREGQPVRFNPVTGGSKDNGLQAIDVEVVR